MPDYARLAETTKRLIEKNGREVTIYKQANAVSVPNTDKPWKGSGTLGQQTPLIEPFTCKAVFAVPATSIPTESRGLAFDWVAKDLLIQARHVLLVAAKGAPFLKEHTVYIDNDGTQNAIIWGQLLKPGDIGLLYVFGTRE